MELTFNLTEDRREPLKPQSLKDFELTFGNGSGVNVQSNNWVQGRLQMDNLRQTFVNIQQGKDNEPFDITGYILQFCGRTPFDGKQQSYRVIDNSSVVVDGLHGRFLYTFPAQAFAVAGTYKQAYFRLIRLSDYKCIATLEFDLSVLEDFVFADMVPSDYISPFNDILNQLLDGEKKFKADTQTLYEEAAKRLNDAVTQLTQLGTDVKTTLTTEQAALQQLIEKIKENNLFTQAEADAFKQKIQEQLDKALTKVDEKLASIFGKGQNPVALSVYWTNWDNDKRQYTQFSVDQMKTSIDGAANYVQGIVVPLRLENDGNQFHVLGNLADIKQGIDYATSKGLKLMGIKIHCVATLEQINNYGMDNFFNDYANSVSAACTSLSLTADTKLTILNERWDLVNEKTYADKVVKLINDLKTATKLSVGISFVQQYLGDAQSSVYSACDFIGLNAYPTVTDLKRSVPFALIASAWQQVAPIIQSLIALYHKPIYLSETGIEDNYEALEDPSNWNVGSQYNSQGEVQYMYFKGLFASGILDYTSAVWIWFDVTSTKAQALIRQYANGVIN